MRLVQTTPYRVPRPAEERGKEETGKEDSNAAISQRRKEEAEKVKKKSKGKEEHKQLPFDIKGLSLTVYDLCQPSAGLRKEGRESYTHLGNEQTEA